MKSLVNSFEEFGLHPATVLLKLECASESPGEGLLDPVLRVSGTVGLKWDQNPPL